MDSGSQATGDGAGGRSGGKILKRRRIAGRKTPYDRPTPPPQPESPNWLNGLVFPAKFVAGGATKLLSSFWNPNTWGSRSSSTDSDSDSEGVLEDDCEDNENPSDGGAALNQNKGSSSGKSEILYLVEQLLTLDRYSREECDRLIQIINSRVGDHTTREELDAGTKNPDIHKKAIMEARKLITKHIVGSSSKSDVDNGSKSLTTPNKDYLSDKGTLSFTDIRTTQDDLPTEAFSSLPTIDEHNQMPEEQNPKESVDVISLGKEKEVEDDITTNNINHIEENYDQNEAINNFNASQGSSNTNDPTSPKKANNPPVRRVATRSRKNTRRGLGRGK